MSDAINGRRPWPDDRIVDCEELLTPLRAAWDRLQAGGPALYDGYEPPSPTSQPIGESLTEKWLDYHRERGRDPLDMLLHAAFRLGMEQGSRVSRHDDRGAAELVLRYLEALSDRSVAVQLVLSHLRRSLAPTEGTTPAASSAASLARVHDGMRAASASIAAHSAQTLAEALRDCAETLRDRVAMADNGDSTLAKCAVACEHASEIVGASLIFPREGA